jgi:branched-chain amino acid transport system permease protein
VLHIPPRLRKALKPVLWILWLLLIASPLLFVRLDYDWNTQTWHANFRAERWQGLWRDVPLWFVRHWIELVTITLVVLVIIGLVKFWRLPICARVRGRVGEHLRIASTRERVSYRTLVCLFVISAVILTCRHSRDTQLEWGVMVCTFIVLAMGLNLTVGMTGLLVLGYAGFMAVGAYTFAVMHEWLGVSLWVAFVPAAILGGALGFVLGLPSIRLRGDYLAIVTLGFGETVRFLIKNFIGEQSIVIARPARVPSLLAGTPIWEGFGNVPVLGNSLRWLFPNGLSRLQVELWVSVAMAALSIWLVRNLLRSRVGRAWVAIREDETAAAAMGIPTVRMKLLAFTLSAVWASVAGVFFVAHNTSANPEMFGFSESVLILSMVVLGGMGNLWGPVIGAVVLYLMPEILRERFPALISYRPMIVGALMVVMMVFRPQGLIGGLRQRIEMAGEPEDADAATKAAKREATP